ncbi:MAG: hypothetical protein KDC80_19065 [Saprospiraceae bacterium]|nr:hypothetical protein [Saprospiraceae bacterium]
MSKIERIKSFVEIIGIVSVVISLVLVWKEMEQNRILAEANFDLMITENSLLANQTIAENPDVWLRGCADDSLSAPELVTFKAMVVNKNDVTFYRVVKSLRIKETGTSQSDWAEFVGFLHDNPGARKVWTEREKTLSAYREKMGMAGINTWFRDIQAALEGLDKEGGQIKDH